MFYWFYLILLFKFRGFFLYVFFFIYKQRVNKIKKLELCLETFFLIFNCFDFELRLHAPNFNFLMSIKHAKKKLRKNNEQLKKALSHSIILNDISIEKLRFETKTPNQNIELMNQKIILNTPRRLKRNISTI